MMTTPVAPAAGPKKKKKKKYYKGKLFSDLIIYILIQIYSNKLVTFIIDISVSSRKCGDCAQEQSVLCTCLIKRSFQNVYFSFIKTLRVYDRTPQV